MGRSAGLRAHLHEVLHRIHPGLGCIRIVHHVIACAEQRMRVLPLKGAHRHKMHQRICPGFGHLRIP